MQHHRRQKAGRSFCPSCSPTTTHTSRHIGTKRQVHMLTTALVQSGEHGRTGNISMNMNLHLQSCNIPCRAPPSCCQVVIGAGSHAWAPSSVWEWSSCPWCLQRQTNRQPRLPDGAAPFSPCWVTLQPNRADRASQPWRSTGRRRWEQGQCIPSQEQQQNIAAWRRQHWQPSCTGPHPVLVTSRASQLRGEGQAQGAARHRTGCKACTSRPRLAHCRQCKQHKPFPVQQPKADTFPDHPGPGAWPAVQQQPRELCTA
jgi:hypothetical protein